MRIPKEIKQNFRKFTIVSSNIVFNGLIIIVAAFVLKLISFTIDKLFTVKVWIIQAMEVISNICLLLAFLVYVIFDLWNYVKREFKNK